MLIAMTHPSRVLNLDMKAKLCMPKSYIYIYMYMYICMYLSRLIRGNSAVVEVTFRLNFESLIQHRQRIKRSCLVFICKHVCAN